MAGREHDIGGGSPELLVSKFSVSLTTVIHQRHCATGQILERLRLLLPGVEWVKRMGICGGMVCSYAKHHYWFEVIGGISMSFTLAVADGFLASGVCEIPSDAIQITDDEHQQLSSGGNSGKLITLAGGTPT